MPCHDMPLFHDFHAAFRHAHFIAADVYALIIFDD